MMSWKEAMAEECTTVWENEHGYRIVGEVTGELEGDKTYGYMAWGPKGSLDTGYMDAQLRAALREKGWKVSDDWKPSYAYSKETMRANLGYYRLPHEAREACEHHRSKQR
jgi:hypothetical protein